VEGCASEVSQSEEVSGCQTNSQDSTTPQAEDAEINFAAEVTAVEGSEGAAKAETDPEPEAAAERSILEEAVPEVTQLQDESGKLAANSEEENSVEKTVETREQGLLLSGDGLNSGNVPKDQGATMAEAVDEEKRSVGDHAVPVVAVSLQSVTESPEETPDQPVKNAPPTLEPSESGPFDKDEAVSTWSESCKTVEAFQGLDRPLEHMILVGVSCDHGSEEPRPDTIQTPVPGSADDVGESEFTTGKSDVEQDTDSGENILI
jgi:hypothetical protein